MLSDVKWNVLNMFIGHWVYMYVCKWDKTEFCICLEANVWNVEKYSWCNNENNKKTN